MANLPMPEGLTNADLECVMLDLPSFDVMEAYGDDVKSEDLFYGSGPDLQYAQGDVGTSSAHVTLLFGIHPSDDYADNVWKVLDWWSCPTVKLDTVSYFDSTVEGEDYKVIVGHIVPTQQLVSGHRRLQALPHTNRFDTYKPHVTLAYIKGSADHVEWIRRMQEAFGNTIYPTLGINLGLDD